MTLEKCMAQGTFTCSPDTQIMEVAELMKANDVGALVIVDPDHKPIGVVTDRDIALRAVGESNNTSATAQSVMTATVTTLPETCDVMEALETMVQEHVRRVPVVDSQGRLTGLVSFGDLLALLVGKLARLVDAVAPELPKVEIAA